MVAICSPPTEHARQIRESVAAGARAILCEKPLATTTEEAREVVDACRRAGVVLLVATNHFYDEAWDRAKHHLVALQSDVRTISATVALPPNGRYHAAVTELATAAPSPRGAPDLADPEIAAAVVRQLVLGLAVHDLPAIRDLAPDFEGVDFAAAVAADRVHGRLPRQRRPRAADGGHGARRPRSGLAAHHRHLDRPRRRRVPASFVHAGSATVRVRAGDLRSTTYRREAEDGYLREWRALAALLDGSATMEYHEVLDDACSPSSSPMAAAAAIRAGAAS